MKGIHQENKRELRESLIVLGALLSIIGIISTSHYFPSLQEISFLRILIGFIYLFCVLGILMARLMKISINIKQGGLLITIGLSLSYIMFFGAFFNTISRFTGVTKPISDCLVYLILFTTLILYLICHKYKLFNRFQVSINPKFKKENNFIIFLFLLPFLSIFSAYLITFHNSNIIWIILILLISFVPLLVVFDKLPPSLYPLAIFTVALSLAYSRSLTTMHIVGWDTHIELYWTSLVLQNSIWDPTIPDNNNAMLSLTLLAPTISLFLGIDTTWIFKAVYPFLLSLIPVGLYFVIKEQVGDKTAFLSCFFFVSVCPFFFDMIGLMKQTVASFFLMLIVLVSIAKYLNNFKKKYCL